MSVSAVRSALDNRDPRLTAPDRFVLVIYAERANAETHRAWPSAATVAAETGLGRTTVERSLGKLRGLGYLVRVAKQTVGEHAWVWVYEIYSTAGDPSERGDVKTARRGRGTPANGAEEPPERGINRKEEPEVKPSAANAPQETIFDVPASASAPEPINLDQQRRNRTWEAICAACGIAGELTESSRRTIGKATRELLAIRATPDEVGERADRFAARRRRRPSPIELVTNWSALGPEPGEGTRDTWLYR